MADKDIDKPTGDAAPPQTDTSAAKPAEAKNDLPVVESPPLSPATEPAAEPAPVASAEIKIEPAPAPTLEPAPEPASSRIALSPRNKRNALLAASVALAAALGAVFGAMATGGSSTPTVDTAALEERKALQQSLARLSHEVTTLKGNLDAANKTASAQLARMNDKLAERLKRESADITASISAPQTAAPAPAPQAVTPLPQPRPVQRVAAVETHRSTLVSGWTIHDVRDGYVYVLGYGDIYRVVPGVPLPGVGVVEQVKRQDGRWMVVTPKGLIVAGRDRRYFDSY